MSQPEKLWHKGPNYTSDAVIFDDKSRICLIKRKSDGSWALPGGFRDDEEDSLTAAQREAFEEAGCVLGPGKRVFSGKVDDPRNTPDRWIESDAFLFHTQEDTLVAGDDAIDAQWFPLDDLPKTLYGSHLTMVHNAQEYLALEEALANATQLHSRGGHMAYDYGLYEIKGTHVFTKRHNPENFDEIVREAHSRYYLYKEDSVLQHLRTHSFLHIPAYHRLVAQSTLVLEGLPEQTGWNWQAPNKKLYDDYMSEVLDALTALNSIPLLEMNEPINPAMDSFYQEGWGRYNHNTQKAIITRLEQFRDQLKPSTAAAISPLIADLPYLSRSQQQLPEPTTVQAHHDARQHNIAWHPDHGVRIVDWSWYSPGPRLADTTTFLIDVAKSQRDVDQYLPDHFDSAHAQMLIGFWLHHSLWPTRHGDEKVRLHQVASALTAYQLVTR